ncbi:MAG: exo-beta-N-acetylmuramidase NamZ domain-containing protein [Prolixibacteraceae bacterium]
MKKLLNVFLLISSIVLGCSGGDEDKPVIPGAENTDNYLPLLRNKNVGLIVNHTSLVEDVHLVDFLLDNNIEVKKIFAPEHGFRGEAAPGEVIEDGIDVKTGIPVISLYGDNKKPQPAQLADLDVFVFDIQDVGCRFYTYISTLHLAIEACAENYKPLIVLDRPNPNGDYIAGPVLEPEFRSFVGMDPIPIVHGCTVGELALMINGEKWHSANNYCELTVVKVENYTHSREYSLPVKPSPNLPNDLAVELYPSLCFFEATSVSVGRGTEFPFQVLGAPEPRLGNFTFTPHEIPGVAVNPLHEGEVCYGIDLRNLKNAPAFTLKYFIDFYKKYENEDEFLTRERWFNLLAGNDRLIQQIREGKSEKEIELSWQPKLGEYKKLRKNYLLYPDFE